MRSTLMRNLIVLCVYSICPSMQKYNAYCDIGIAIAVSLIEAVIDTFRNKNNQTIFNQKNCNKFRIR